MMELLRANGLVAEYEAPKPVRRRQPRVIAYERPRGFARRKKSVSASQFEAAYVNARARYEIEHLGECGFDHLNLKLHSSVERPIGVEQIATESRREYQVRYDPTSYRELTCVSLGIYAKAGRLDLLPSGAV